MYLFFWVLEKVSSRIKIEPTVSSIQTQVSRQRRTRCCCMLLFFYPCLLFVQVYLCRSPFFLLLFLFVSFSLPVMSLSSCVFVFLLLLRWLWMVLRYCWFVLEEMAIIVIVFVVVAVVVCFSCGGKKNNKKWCQPIHPSHVCSIHDHSRSWMVQSLVTILETDYFSSDRFIFAVPVK